MHLTDQLHGFGYRTEWNCACPRCNGANDSNLEYCQACREDILTNGALSLIAPVIVQSNCEVRRERQAKAAQSAAYQSAIACADAAFDAWKFSETANQSDLNAFATTTARAINSAVRVIQ